MPSRKISDPSKVKRPLGFILLTGFISALIYKLNASLTGYEDKALILVLIVVIVLIILLGVTRILSH